MYNSRLHNVSWKVLLIRLHEYDIPKYGFPFYFTVCIRLLRLRDRHMLDQLIFIWTIPIELYRLLLLQFKLMTIVIKYAQGSGIYKHCFFWHICTRLFHQVLLVTYDMIFCVQSSKFWIELNMPHWICNTFVNISLKFLFNMAMPVSIW